MSLGTSVSHTANIGCISARWPYATSSDRLLAAHIALRVVQGHTESLQDKSHVYTVIVWTLTLSCWGRWAGRS
jgi:hypothetical protein